MGKHGGQTHEASAKFQTDLASWQNDVAATCHINSRLCPEGVGARWQVFTGVCDDVCSNMKFLFQQLASCQGVRLYGFFGCLPYLQGPLEV